MKRCPDYRCVAYARRYSVDRPRRKPNCWLLRKTIKFMVPQETAIQYTLHSLTTDLDDCRMNDRQNFNLSYFRQITLLPKGIKLIWFQYNRYCRNEFAVLAFDSGFIENFSRQWDSGAVRSRASMQDWFPDCCSVFILSVKLRVSFSIDGDIAKERRKTN